MNILVQSVKINNCSCTKGRKQEDCCSYRSCKLFVSENWFEVVKVDYSIANISSLKIDIPLSSESIQFSTKISKAKPNDKIKLGEIFKPLCLSANQHLGSRKILKIFIIYNNVDRKYQTFEIMALNFESFKYGQKFLIMNAIIQLYQNKRQLDELHYFYL